MRTPFELFMTVMLVWTGAVSIAATALAGKINKGKVRGYEFQ